MIWLPTATMGMSVAGVIDTITEMPEHIQTVPLITSYSTVVNRDSGVVSVLNDREIHGAFVCSN